jgi:hypothetical protein
MHRRILAALLFAPCLWSGSALAQLPYFEPVPAAGLLRSDDIVTAHSDVQRTDNALRTPTNEETDTLASVGLAGAYRYNSGELDITGKGDMSWVKYLSGSFHSELNGYFDGGALWGTPAEFFQWTLHDTVQQLRDDPLAAETPANLETVNNLTTGPAFNFHFPASTRLTIFTLYTKTSYSETKLDSNDGQVGFSLAHNLSPQSRISFNAVAQRVLFQNTELASDYDRQEAYFRFDTAQPRTALSADVGITTLHDYGVTDKGPLFRAELARRISPMTVFRLSAAQQFTSAAQSNGAETGPNGNVRVAQGFASADPFRARSSRADWVTTGPRTGFTLGAFWADERHQAQFQLNRSYWGGQASVYRNLRPTLIVRLSAVYDNEQFTQVAGNDRESTIAAELEDNFGRHLGLVLRVARYRRTSGAQPDTDFVENRYGIMLVDHLAGI